MRKQAIRWVAWANIPQSEEDENRMNSVIEVMEEFTPLIEYIPPGGFYLDFTEGRRLYRHPGEALGQLCSQLKKRGFTGVFGLGPNKFLARSAGSVLSPGEIFWVLEQGKSSFLEGLPIESWPGLGMSRARQLRLLGIRRIADLLQISPYWVRMVFKKRGDLMLKQAQGNDPRPVVRRLPRSGSQMVGGDLSFSFEREAEKLHLVLADLRSRYARKMLGRKRSRGIDTAIFS